MVKQVVRLPGGQEPPLDIFSAGRRGPESRDRFGPGQVSQIARTVRRTPEVMVKVTGGGTKFGAVRAHFSYISRNGTLDVETDEGQSAKGKDALKDLLDDWHLDLSTGQYRRSSGGKPPGRALKLVYHVVLSMPAPTPPEKVLAAAKKFGREKFGIEHRYAMVLHTDQRNPHVHLVVKAEGLRGPRLHIDKRLLREWRGDFALYMREQGVAANATKRFIRGRSGSKNSDAILRARRRNASSETRERVQAVARELASGTLIHDPGREKLLKTRKTVVAGWLAVAKLLDRQGESSLAAEVRKFVREMPPVMTDKERIAHQLLEVIKERRAAARTRDPEREQERTR